MDAYPSIFTRFFTISLIGRSLICLRCLMTKLGQRMQYLNLLVTIDGCHDEIVDEGGDRSSETEKIWMMLFIIDSEFNACKLVDREERSVGWHRTACNKSDAAVECWHATFGVQLSHDLSESCILYHLRVCLRMKCLRGERDRCLPIALPLFYVYLNVIEGKHRRVLDHSSKATGFEW